MSVFDTSQVPGAKRFDYWQDVVCTHYVSARCANINGTQFDGRLTFRELGQFGIGSLDASPHRWQRDTHQIAADGREDFLLSLVVNGQASIGQSGRDLRQQVGSLTLYDTRRPFDYAVAGRMLVFKIRRSLLLAHAPLSESLCIREFGGAHQLRSVLANMLLHAADDEEPVAGRTLSMAHLGNAIFNLVLTLVDATGDDLPTSLSAAQARQLDGIKSRIIAHLADPALSCDRIAAMSGVSLRTLNRLFAHLGTTPMRWVWRQRLELSRDDLANGRVQSVTEAAMRAGFNELSHFSRAFKSAFGATPQSVLRSASGARA